MTDFAHYIFHGVIDVGEVDVALTESRAYHVDIDVSAQVHGVPSQGVVGKGCGDLSAV